MLDAQKLSAQTATEITLRSRAQIADFFGDFELLEPGVVHMPLWRPDSPDDVDEHPERFGAFGGVGRKPADHGPVDAGCHVVRRREISTAGAQRYAGRWAQAIARGVVRADGVRRDRTAAARRTRSGWRRRCRRAVHRRAGRARSGGRWWRPTSPSRTRWTGRCARSARTSSPTVLPGARPSAGPGDADRRRCRAALAAGFARALRDRTFAQQERISRSRVGRRATRRSRRCATARRGSGRSSPAPRSASASPTLDGRIIDVNQAFADMLGYSRRRVARDQRRGAVPRRRRRRACGSSTRS